MTETFKRHPKERHTHMLNRLTTITLGAIVTTLVAMIGLPSTASAATSNPIVHVVDPGSFDPPIIIRCANGNGYNVFEGHSSKEFCGTVTEVYNYADAKIQVKVETGNYWVDAYTYYGWQPARQTWHQHRTVRA